MNRGRKLELLNRDACRNYKNAMYTFVQADSDIIRQKQNTSHLTNINTTHLNVPGIYDYPKSVSDRHFSGFRVRKRGVLRNKDDI